jgi:glutamate/aspartate transport system substrate-binding protein
MRYDLPPFGYVTEGEVAGFDVDLGRELAHRWLQDPEAVRFRQVRSDTAADHLLAGDVDLVLTALVHSQAAEEQVDFGLPLFIDGQAFLVHAAEALSITAPSDLAGMPVAVVDGAEAGGALEASGPLTPTIMTYESLEAAVDALAQGEVRAVADLRRRLVRGLPTVVETTIAGQYSWLPVAPAYPPNEPGMADLVALTFQELTADGTLQELRERWMPSDDPPSVERWPGSAVVTLAEMDGPARRYDTLGAIRSRGRLRVAVTADRFPFAYVDGAGAASGFEVQLVQSLVERWLGDPVAVDFLVVSREEGLRMVLDGEADLLAGAMPHTREAELQTDFSLTTYVAGEGLMSRADAVPEGIPGLSGQTVAALSGAESANVLRRAADQLGVSLSIVPRDTLEEAALALQAGEVEAVVGERGDLLRVAFAMDGLAVTPDRLTQIPLALVLPPGDSAFRDWVNLTLQAMVEDGAFESVYWQWFDDQPPEFQPWPGEPIQLMRIQVGADLVP